MRCIGTTGSSGRCVPGSGNSPGVDADSPHTQGLRDVEKAEPELGLRLYDLEPDPVGTIEVAANNPATAERLAALHGRWRALVADSAAEPAQGS